MADDLPYMERARIIRPVTLSISCPCCDADHEIDAETGLEEQIDGSYMATEVACVPCDCGAFIEVPDIMVDFKPKSGSLKQCP